MFSAWVPNPEKQIIIVWRCLESLIKHEARVFDRTAQFFLTKYEFNVMIFCFIRQVIGICKGNEYSIFG